MELLAPAQLAWLSLLVPLIALYILKRRREERTVGSTLLWEAALRDMRAERPFKKLILHLSLILQILAILLGAFALARPAGAGSVPRGARVALVIDTSASMAGVDASGPRIDRAKTEARSIARGLPPGGELMVIEAAAEPVVIAPSTHDATALTRAIDSLAVRGGRSDLPAAVALAAERLRDAPPGSRIIVLTDGAIDGDVALETGTLPVDVRPLGASSENTGIIAVDVRAKPTDDAPDRVEVFARLRRFGSRADDVFVTATEVGHGGDDAARVVASRRVRIEPNATESVIMTADLPPDSRGRASVVRVEISRDEGRGDGLALDDVVVAPSPAGRKLPTFLVDCGASPVQRVARADENVELFATTLEALAARDEEEEGALDGLHVFCGAVPDRPPPGDSIVIGPVAEHVFEAQLAAPVEHPRIVTWDEEDARLRFVSMSSVHVGAIRPIRSGARTLVNSDGGAAISAIERPDGETTILAFDPAASDWPTQVGFVIFFRNVFERARDRRAAGGVPAGTLGEALRVPAPDGERVSVSTPSGTDLSAISRGGLAIVPTGAEPGVYRVAAGHRALFAIRNLLDPVESDLRPRARFTQGGRRTDAVLRERAEHQEAWPWLAAALLIVLALEALWATRKVGAPSLIERLRARFRPSPSPSRQGGGGTSPS